MLATYAGESLAMFLARHKKGDCLGRRMIKSVTIFVTDSMITTFDSVRTGKKQQMLLKWPVLIWEIVRFDQAHVDKARQFDVRFLRSNGDHRLGSNGNPKFPSEENPQLAKDYVTEKPRIALPYQHLRSAKKTPGNMMFI